jgi:hypothetical protein
MSGKRNAVRDAEIFQHQTTPLKWKPQSLHLRGAQTPTTPQLATVGTPEKIIDCSVIIVALSMKKKWA